MDTKRITEWLGTVEGIGKAILALLGVIVAAWAATSQALAFLPPWALRAALLLLIAAFLWILWHSYRRYAQASRLEQPDAFTLRPTNPDSLIGRHEDLARLLKAVKHHRLVLLDGESGCGKSALVAAGLIPRLREAGGLLPILIRDWGEDWERGPIAATLDALFNAMSEDRRNRLQWRTAPDLTAETQALTLELSARLREISDVLGARPLLIADQFDDYQARHRSRFVNGEGGWTTPRALVEVNRFWNVVNDGLCGARLHLLVVTRADVGLRLTTVKFLGDDQTATHTLPLVDVDYLRPLLAGVAPDDLKPPIVSNPAGGWFALRELLERDLRTEVSILMQQVRTVLLGVRQLRPITPKQYRIAGGLRGVESLAISRALRRAAATIGGGHAELRTARAVLGALVLPGGPNQAPKAQRRSLTELGEIAGTRARAESTLHSLRDDEVVRPAEATDDKRQQAWQLDHDYLARAVLAEARQADRWSAVLREGKTAFESAAGDWRRRWAALLPTATLTRVYWERARGRLKFRDAAGYARLSAIRPALLAVFLGACAVAANIWNQDRLLTAQAMRLVERFSDEEEGLAAVTTAWRGAEPLRQRIYDLVVTDQARAKRAARSRWPLSHAGYERTRILEAAALLRERLERERSDDVSAQIVATNAILVARIHAAEDLKSEAQALQARLAQPLGFPMDVRLAQAYSAVAARLTDAQDIRTATALLRTRLLHVSIATGQEYAARYDYQQGYRAVAARLRSADDIRNEAAALLDLAAQASDDFRIALVADAYAELIVRLADSDDTRRAVAFMRARLAEEPVVKAVGWADAFATVAAQLGSTEEIRAAAITLQTWMERASPDLFISPVEAYLRITTPLTDPADVNTTIRFLRPKAYLRGTRSNYRQEYVGAYGKAVARLKTAEELKTEADTLQPLLLSRTVLGGLDHEMARAYATIAARMTSADERREAAENLRRAFENDRGGSNIVHAYATVAASLTDPGDVRSAAEVLRAALKREPDSSIAAAYAMVAMRLDDTDDMRVAAQTLRETPTRDYSDCAGFGQRYVSLAMRLEPDDLRTEIDALAERVRREPVDWTTVCAIRAYATLAAKLEETATMEAAIATLQVWLDQQPASVSELAHPYATLALKLGDANDLRSRADFLRTLLERGDPTDALVQAYATIVSALPEPTDSQARSALAREILTLASYPLLNDAEPLLALLKPAGFERSGALMSEAVSWAETTHGIAAAQLRPAASQSD